MWNIQFMMTFSISLKLSLFYSKMCTFMRGKGK